MIRAYRAAGKRTKYPPGYWPHEWIAIVETMARIDARRQARDQERDRHAYIVEAARQMDRMRWHVYGSGIARQFNKGWTNKLPDQELKNRHRQRNRKRKQAELIALKIYRSMGFIASRKDRRAIYKALKAELPTLNILARETSLSLLEIGKTGASKANLAQAQCRGALLKLLMDEAKGDPHDGKVLFKDFLFCSSLRQRYARRLKMKPRNAEWGVNIIEYWFTNNHHSMVGQLYDKPAKEK